MTKKIRQILTSLLYILNNIKLDNLVLRRKTGSSPEPYANDEGSLLDSIIKIITKVPKISELEHRFRRMFMVRDLIKGVPVSTFHVDLS